MSNESLPPAGSAVNAAPLPSGPPGPPPVQVQVVSFTPPKMFKVWPPPASPATPWVLVAALISGVVGALAVPWSSPGVGWIVTGLVVTASTWFAVRSLPGAARRPWSGLVWAAAAVVLLATVGVLAAPWFGLLCVMTAFGCGALAVGGGRTTRTMLVGVCLLPLAALRALVWAGRGRGYRPGSEGRGGSERGGGSQGRRGSPARVVAAVVVSAVLLVVFAALFAGADPVFARVLALAVPTVDGGTVFRWVFSLAVLVPGTLGACFLLASPRPPGPDGSPARTWRRLEWALPAGTLVAVFAAFVAVQATVLFGGADHVLRTENLTYAQYARTGFWQLLVVTVLTLLIMAVVARKAIRDSAADRTWLRGVLGVLAVLSLIVVASALGRMWTYEQAYGFSRLRVLVSACELWLGVVFVLVIAAGVRLSAPARWLPRAVVGTGVAAVIGLAALNPDRFIADRNVDRFTQTGTIDLAYLGTLSVDAVPALDRLPEPQRSCVLAQILDHAPSSDTDGWRGWTVNRRLSDRLIADHPVTAGATCPYQVVR